ncbi:MAG: TonB family protein [Proteobacteria bacterium]|nr:TonB family protein [Pseudomonadota bacterium]MDA1300274.1 TonB family protein [Pseudomonadota bacterium]
MTRNWLSQPAVCMVLAIAFTTCARADERGDFEQSYARYERHMEANEPELALASARDAYRLGTRLFGQDSVNTANLAINYATLLNDSNDFKSARKVLKGKLRILEARYGKDAVELVPIAIQTARAAKDPTAALEHLQRAASLSQGYEDDLMEAQRNFDILTILLARGGTALTEPYVDRAYEIYSDRLDARDFRLGLMAYHKSRWASHHSEFDQGIDYLLQALVAFKGAPNEPMGDLELNVRIQLVQLLEQLGRSDQATEHLLKLSAAIPWSASAEPVYRRQAEFPPGVVQSLKDGAVRLSFTVDGNGFVTDPRVIESSNAVLNDAAIRMVLGFRYVPRLVDGHTVSTPGVEYRESFTFAAGQKPGASRFTRAPVRGFMNEDLFDISGCSSEVSTARSCELLGPGGGGK